MTEIGIGLIALAVLLLIYQLATRRRRKARLEQLAAEMPKQRASTFDTEVETRAPVADFHVHGDQATVTFDVPLPEEKDPILIDLLLAEATEVVREKRHTLPIDEVTQIVVFAGRDQVREIGRTKLPSAGELPPPIEAAGLSFSHIARDPFAGQFEKADHSVTYETKVDVPPDELGPLRKELKLPKSLERGLRATGVDPDSLSGPEFVLSLLRMFGYSVSEHPTPSSYMAIKEGVSTYIRTVAHTSGEHPELEESEIRRFMADFGLSGAERGMLLTDKYSPFMIHEIESHQPKVRFITRERVQRFVDSMALG